MSLGAYFEWVQTEIFQLFRDGKASPYDLTADGRTLITVSMDQTRIKNASINICCKCLALFTDVLDPDSMCSYRNLLFALLSADVPYNEINCSG